MPPGKDKSKKRSLFGGLSKSLRTSKSKSETTTGSSSITKPTVAECYQLSTVTGPELSSLAPAASNSSQKNSTLIARPALSQSDNANLAPVEPDDPKPGLTIASNPLAIDEFRENYTTFVKKNSQFVLFDEEVQGVFQTAETHADIRRGAKTFGDGISAAIEAIGKKKKLAAGNWITKLGNILNKLYPVVRLSVSLLTSVGDAVSLSPLKATATGLGIILQIIDTEATKGEKFLFNLRRIKFQAALISDNPVYDLNSQATRDLVGEKSGDLMTAIIKFFNAALVHFSNSFISNLARSVNEGKSSLDGAQELLDVAIKEYDQAVFHLAARTIASLKYGQESDQRERQDEKFLKWLSPSYWLVEAQLHSFRKQRGKNTLQWAPDLEEFQNWRLADHSSCDRILWIRGSLGIGKSTLAGYYIDLLKCHCPNSIVAYFFCRSNQAGLVKARDIIRTLAYQCLGCDPVARVMLEDLRTNRFCIEDSLGVSFLFQKLLLEPVRATKKDLFVIIDGLDEADLTTIDETDRSERPEMTILLKCLTTLPLTRLLFLSRPAANIASIVATIVKQIGMAENGTDITAYVAKTIAESDKLRAFFNNETVDPLKYFQDKANGIFLWVVLVLQQLEASKSKSTFQKRLNGFSAASGSMDKLYVNILSKVADEDRKWVREIIRWLVAAERQLSDPELKKAVEWRLKDSLADFRGFLEVECGSVLYLPPDSSKTVQLIHETFRSFILKSEICPIEFLLCEEEIHGEMVLDCLRDLTEFGEQSFTAMTYGLNEWVKHLLKSTASHQLEKLLSCLVDFVASDSMTVWIRRHILRQPRQRPSFLNPPWQIDVERATLSLMVKWLEQCQSSMSREGIYDIEWDKRDTRTTTLQLILKNPSAKVGEHLGKAAANLWLKEELSCIEAQRSFSLALKYFLVRECQYENNLNALTALTMSEFGLLSRWSGSEGTIPLPQNAAMAYFTLQRWNMCVKCFEEAIMHLEPNVEVLRHLGIAYMAKGDYDAAIETFWRIIERYNMAKQNDDEIWLRPGLLQAYEGKGNYDDAINRLKDVVDKSPENLAPKICLGYMFIAKEEYDASIRLFEDTQASDRNVWFCLLTVHKMKRDYQTSIEKLQKYARTPFYGRQMLLDCNYDAGNFDEIVEKSDYRDGGMFLEHLFTLCSAKKRWDVIIRVFEDAVNDPLPSLNIGASTVVEAYKSKGIVDGAIKVFKALERREEYQRLSLLGILEAYNSMGDYDLAIKTFHDAVKHSANIGNRGESVSSVLAAYRMKGDFDGAIKFIDSHSLTSDFWRGVVFRVILLCKAINDPKRVIQILNREVNVNPLSSWAWHSLAAAHNLNEDFEATVYTYHTASEYISLDYSFNLQLGDVLVKKSRYDDAISAYDVAIRNACKKSILWAFLDRRNLDPNYDGPACPFVYAYHPSRGISIDDRLWKHFLWYCLGQAHKGISDNDGAANVYAMAIEGIQYTLKKKGRNDLLWLYRGTLVSPGLDVFSQPQGLPKGVLWSALGKAYECNGDAAQALKAYHMAADIEQNNAWLQNVIVRLEKDVGCSKGREGRGDTEFWLKVDDEPQSKSIEESWIETPIWQVLGTPSMFRKSGKLNVAQCR